MELFLAVVSHVKVEAGSRNVAAKQNLLPLRGHFLKIRHTQKPHISSFKKNLYILGNLTITASARQVGY